MCVQHVGDDVWRLLGEGVAHERLDAAAGAAQRHAALGVGRRLQHRLAVPLHRSVCTFVVQFYARAIRGTVKALTLEPVMTDACLFSRTDRKGDSGPEHKRHIK